MVKLEENFKENFTIPLSTDGRIVRIGETDLAWLNALNESVWSQFREEGTGNIHSNYLRTKNIEKDILAKLNFYDSHNKIIKD
jgi:hypothetical protein